MGLYFGVLANIVAIVGGFFGIVRLANNFVSNSFNRKRKNRYDDYAFTQKFLSEIKKKDKDVEEYEHPLFIEKGFYALTGKGNLSAMEILYCLKQKNPTLFLNNYPSVRGKYLEYSYDRNIIVFKGRYKNKWVRNLSWLGNYLLFLLYYLFGYGFIVVIFKSKFVSERDWSWWQTAMTINSIIIIIFLISIFCMIQGMRMRLAKEIVAEQETSHNEMEMSQMVNQDE